MQACGLWSVWECLAERWGQLTQPVLCSPSCEPQSTFFSQKFLCLSSPVSAELSLSQGGIPCERNRNTVSFIESDIWCCSLKGQSPEPAPWLRRCGKQHPRDRPRKHAQWTYLGRDVLSALRHGLPPMSVPMKTKQAVPDQQQSLNFILPLWCAEQAPQYCYSLMISCDFYQQKCGLKGAISSSCQGEQEGPLTPRLPNDMCLSFHYAPAPVSDLFHPAVLGAAIWDRNTNSLYSLYPVHEAGQGEKKLGTDAIFWPPLFSSSCVDTGPKASCFNKNSKLTSSYILPTISFTSLALKSLGMVIIIYRLSIRKLRLRDVR